MNSKVSRSKWLATSALLSAMASVLMFWELPVPLMPPFIKLDFSLLPCIIGSIALGPTSGIVVTTIKELIHLMIRGASSTGGVGNLADYVTCLCVVVPAGLIYKRLSNIKGLILGLTVGSICSGILSGLVFNALVIYPLYDKFMLPMQQIIAMYQKIRPSANGLWEVLAIFNMPFTFLKCLIISIIAIFIAKPLDRYVLRRN
ncbi:MAG: ECF transporter S component [Clostridia bacterium]|nr:ECF transporter S component [Clostridia bacterium]MDE6758213.1 ECF transporter S component [Clostridia bacterium]MDE7079803.1 ECF transporter S component [Clostridia bacterium]